MIFRLALLLVALSLPALNQAESHALQRALGLFNSGKYDECLALVSAYLRQNPNSATAHKILGMDQYTLGRSAEALTEMKRAIELAPNDADAFYYLGRLYFSADNAVAALAAFERAIQLDASSVRAHNQLGQTYEALGRQREAERAYLRAIELEQNTSNKSEWPYYNLGLLYLNDGQVDNALLFLRKALARNASFPEAKIKLAVILSKQNLTGEALRLLQEALESDPANAEGHYRLGLLLLKSGKREEAQQQLALFERYRKR
jgi:tetratricopeptide (TPR) repeat protein